MTAPQVYGLPVPTASDVAGITDPVVHEIARRALTQMAIRTPDVHAAFKANAARLGLAPLDLMVYVAAAEDQR